MFTFEEKVVFSYSRGIVKVSFKEVDEGVQIPWHTVPHLTACEVSGVDDAWISMVWSLVLIFIFPKAVTSEEVGVKYSR